MLEAVASYDAAGERRGFGGETENESGEDVASAALGEAGGAAGYS